MPTHKTRVVPAPAEYERRSGSRLTEYHPATSPVAPPVGGRRGTYRLRRDRITNVTRIATPLIEVWSYDHCAWSFG